MSEEDPIYELTYRGGYGKLIPSPDARRPYDGMAETLAPYARAELETLWSTPTVAPSEVPAACYTAQEKLAELSARFADQPLALTLHALTIAAARREAPPAEAKELFLRLWTQNGPRLRKTLDRRWQLSALQTFVDFGANETQRRAAARLTTFFQVVKLYEFERLHSRFAPDEPFKLWGAHKGPMPYQLEKYSLGRGDLDRNMLGTLWLEAEEDPVLRPLACGLLNDVNLDQGGLFRRLQKMKLHLKQRRARRVSEKK